MSKIFIIPLILFISIQCQIFAQNTPIFKGGDIVKLTGVISRSSEKETDSKITHYTWLNLDFPIAYRDDPQYAESEVVEITKLWISGKDIQKFKQSARIEAEGALYLWRGEGGAPCMAIKSARLVTLNDDIINSNFDNIPILLNKMRATDSLSSAFPSVSVTIGWHFNEAKSSLLYFVNGIAKTGSKWSFSTAIDLTNVKISSNPKGKKIYTNSFSGNINILKFKEIQRHSIISNMIIDGESNQSKSNEIEFLISSSDPEFDELRNLLIHYQRELSKK